MSLQQQAVRCFANQQIYTPLNAFIASTNVHAQKYTREAERADARLKAGIALKVMNHSHALIVLQALRNRFWMGV
jgi:hypothetical protein